MIRLLSAGFLVSASDARVGVTSLWIISSSCSSEYIDMKALTGLLLLVFGHGVSSGKTEDSFLLFNTVFPKGWFMVPED